jgi:hypothetical protein
VGGIILMVSCRFVGLPSSGTIMVGFTVSIAFIKIDKWVIIAYLSVLGMLLLGICEIKKYNVKYQF